MRAGLGCWRKGRGTLSWVLTILPSKYLHPLLSPSSSLPGPGPPSTPHPAPCLLLSDGLRFPRCWLKSPSSPRIWEAPATFLQFPPLNPTLLSLQSGPVATSGAAASIPAWFRFPQTHTLLRLSLTSPARRPSSLPSSPFLVRSKPGQLHPPLHPRAPGSRAPLPFPLSCYPGFLRFSVRQSSLPLIPPIAPPRAQPPQFLHKRTWPAGRRPPHAGLRPEQEEGGGETERDWGKPSWVLPQRQPRLRVRPQTRPRPQTHPSTFQGRRGAAAWRGWELRGPRRTRGATEKGCGALGTRRQPDPALGRPLLAASRPVPGRACSVRWPRSPRSEARRSAQRCPPAAGRGLHRRESLVRQGLPGCAPRDWQGRVCGCGTRGAVRRRDRQGGPLSGPRGSETGAGPSSSLPSRGRAPLAARQLPAAPPAPPRCGRAPCWLARCWSSIPPASQAPGLSFTFWAQSPSSPPPQPKSSSLQPLALRAEPALTWELWIDLTAAPWPRPDGRS